LLFFFLGGGGTTFKSQNTAVFKTSEPEFWLILKTPKIWQCWYHIPQGDKQLELVAADLSKGTRALPCSPPLLMLGASWPWKPARVSGFFSALCAALPPPGDLYPQRQFLV